MVTFKSKRRILCNFCKMHCQFLLKKFPKNKVSSLRKIERQKQRCRNGRGSSNKYSKPAKERIKISKRPHILAICKICSKQKLLRTKLATKFTIKQ